jgi:NhaP-type Na+/H+ or K+/H+ antiporter
MDGLILIMILITIIILLIGVVISIYVYKKRKQGEIREPNYQAFFTMGISFLALGIILSAAVGPAFIGFVGLGIIYMIIGLVNRNKWEKKK